jgi:hypothetical protein
MAPTTSACELDAFAALLHAINPFVDDLLRQPEFHRFMDLPIELRYFVYEHYFEEDTKSLACAERTSHIDMHCIDVEPPNHRISAPFLPSLCLVSRAIRVEVTSLLLRAVEFQVRSCSSAHYFLRKIDRCPSIPLRENILGLALWVKDSYSISRALSELPKSYMEIDHAYSLLLKRFTNVQNLEINFHARFSVADYFTRPAACEMLILYNLETFLRTGMLQRLRINYTDSRSRNVNGAKIWLQKVAGFARKVKDGLEGLGSDVKVEVGLRSRYWSNYCAL